MRCRGNEDLWHHADVSENTRDASLCRIKRALADRVRQSLDDLFARFAAIVDQHPRQFSKHKYRFIRNQREQLTRRQITHICLAAVRHFDLELYSIVGAEFLNNEWNELNGSRDP